MNGRRYALFGQLGLAAALMLAVWFLVVWVASRPALKSLIDLTPQRTNSIDPATEELLRDLRAQKVEVQFHLFFPAIEGRASTDAEVQAIAIRMRLRELTRTLLRSYQYVGGENVTIHDHDFYGDPAGTRDAAQRFDFKAPEGEVVVVAVRQEGREWRYRKLSVITDLAEIDLPTSQGAGGPAGQRLVPVLKNYLGEQGISSTMKSLLVQGAPVVYVMNQYSPGLDVQSAAGSSYRNFLRGLGEAGFDVRGDLDLQKAGVPADAALVIVLEPRRDFTDRDAEALFAYVQRGGRLFLNYAWAGLSDWNPDGGKLGQLLGYTVGPQLVCHLIPDFGTRTGGRPIDGPGVEKLQLQANPQHPVTKRFVQGNRPIEVAAAREVTERPSAPTGMRREDLLATGGAGWLAVQTADGPDLRAPRTGLRAITVGMAIEVDAAAPAKAGESARPGQVVIIGGVFCNNTGLPFFGDLAFNICNWLTDRRVLMDIRGSRYEAKHFDLTQPQLDRVFWLLVGWVPLGFLVGLFVVLWMRRRA